MLSMYNCLYHTKTKKSKVKQTQTPGQIEKNAFTTKPNKTEIQTGQEKIRHCRPC